MYVYVECTYSIQGGTLCCKLHAERVLHIYVLECAVMSGFLVAIANGELRIAHCNQLCDCNIGTECTVFTCYVVDVVKITRVHEQ